MGVVFACQPFVHMSAIHSPISRIFPYRPYIYLSAICSPVNHIFTLSTGNGHVDRSSDRTEDEVARAGGASPRMEFVIVR